MGNCQNNCYLGISEDRLAHAEYGILRFANMKPDQLKIRNYDINKRL